MNRITGDLFTFQFGIISHPLSSLEGFLRHKKRLGYSFMTVIIFGLLYTIGVAFAYGFDHLPYGIDIVLNIPVEQYYLFESFFLLPVTICTWVLLAGLIQIISIPFKGEGTFEDTLALTGLPFFLLIIFMFIPDVIVDYLLPQAISESRIFRQFINPIRLFLASFWVLAIHILAVKTVQRVSILKAVSITVLAYIPYMAMVLTFIR